MTLGTQNNAATCKLNNNLFKDVHVETHNSTVSFNYKNTVKITLEDYKYIKATETKNIF